MSGKKWQELPRPVRVGLVTAGGAEAALKVWSLIDLVRRPADQVRGPKALWAFGLMTVNSLGAVPLIYLAKGRRH
ncbi:hypothetical protein [Acidipropionibacterium virtanenii]|uniref:DUF5652 domain-containing protein n=1 Tax=Acidipropionibacterium virtanenii TaxID=2057246 RepID=A0A344UWY8_9ACTN|nr:hypothetical protein [Acidipropionibacterium virtanenii]AXE39786.1 hypothetical protein JS278_02649 [Acidipropionibacterium virtanenii]